MDGSSSPGTSSDCNEIDFTGVELGKELTNKFLSGQISFADYSNEWYINEDDDDNEEDKADDQVQKTAPDLPTLPSRPKRRKYTKLSAALTGLVGEANVRLARGDIETAEQMCYEVIRQLPIVPEPYQTLAQIYEHDPEKSLQFSFLAAHLGRTDSNEWLRLAAISRERNDPRQEMICYSEAIKAEPHNLELHLKRLNLLNSLEESKYPYFNALNLTAVRCYHKIVTSLRPSDGDDILKYAKIAANMYHKNNETDRAVAVMATAYKKCSSKFTLEDLNIFIELLILCKQYQTCLEVLIVNAGVEVEAEIQTVKNSDGLIEEHTNYLKCIMPTNLPIDLKTKLLLCFIFMGSYNLVQTLLNDFLVNDVEKTGDLYMDIEEALSKMGQYELAMQVLDPLVKNKNFDLGAVWLKHADCLLKLGRIEDAVQSYYQVLKHVPQHPEARRKLFTILEEKGLIDEALDILQQDYNYVVSASILYEYCCALKKYGRDLKYLDVGSDLLSKTFGRYRHRDELSMATQVRGGKDLIHNFRTMRGENPYNEDDIHFDESETFKLSPEQEWNLFTELLTIAFLHKNYPKMLHLTYGALLSKNLYERQREIRFYCYQACLLNNDHTNAFKLIKELNKKICNAKTWNLINITFHNIYNITYMKFMSRLFQRELQKSPMKKMFMGNSLLGSGRYLGALKYYLDYHNESREPLSALLIAITILVMAAQRTVDKHHNLILQGLSYMLQYQNLRQCDQETYYNIGRTYQMLTINNLAIEYYERALKSPPAAHCPRHGVISLEKEIAFNLYILYKNHSPNMARKYMLKYLVIE